MFRRFSLRQVILDAVLELAYAFWALSVAHMESARNARVLGDHLPPILVSNSVADIFLDVFPFIPFLLHFPVGAKEGVAYRQNHLAKIAAGAPSSPDANDEETGRLESSSKEEAVAPERGAANRGVKREPDAANPLVSYKESKENAPEPDTDRPLFDAPSSKDDMESPLFVAIPSKDDSSKAANLSSSKDGVLERDVENASVPKPSTPELDIDTTDAASQINDAETADVPRVEAANGGTSDIRNEVASSTADFGGKQEAYITSRRSIFALGVVWVLSLATGIAVTALVASASKKDDGYELVSDICKTIAFDWTFPKGYEGSTSEFGCAEGANMERGGDCHECKIGVRGLCPLWEAQIWREQGIRASLHSDAIHTLWGTVVCAQSTLQSRHRNWDEVPQYLTSRFYNTRELDLTGSRVRDMGDLVERFVLLESLAAPENELAVLPDSLGDLRHLESLDVNRNHLQELPDSLLKLTDLLKLHATGNDLTAVPDLGPLTKLLDLDLSMNQIHDSQNGSTS